MTKAQVVRYTVAIPAMAAVTCWHGELVLAGGQGNPAFEAIGDLLDYFSRLANSGALVSGPDRLHDTGMVIATVHTPGCLRTRFTARFLHLGAWRILLQMLGHCREMESYSDLTLAADGAPTDRLDRPCLLSQPYPERWVAGPLRCGDAGSWLGGEAFSLRLDFARDITPGELATIRLLVDDWGTLVYTGGFTSLDQTITEEILNKPETYLLGPQAIEIAVTGWHGEPQAIETLVNLTLGLSRTLPVIAVELQ